MPVEFTRRGYIEIWRDGAMISRHTSEFEAIESLTEHAAEHGDGNYELRFPDIMAKAYGVLSPGQTDTVAPTTPGSLTGAALSATAIRLTWTASTDNIGVAGYQVFRNGLPVGTTTSLSYDVTGLTPSTQYSFTVTAYDLAGNNSPAAGPALVTTNSNSAPVWSLGNQSYNNGQAVNISLDSYCTDADGDTITYSLVSGSLPTGLALSGARNQTLSGTVTADGSYAFTLGASDGIAATSQVSLSFVVSTPDTTAPNPPSAPTVASYTSSTITLTLPTSAAGDHASYTIQRSTDGTNYGNRATSITASTWQDTGLNSSTTYYYRLLDVDVSGNISAAGSAVSQQTSAPAAGTNAGRIDALLAGRSPHFAYSPPTDPSIVRERTVTNATDFNTYANVANSGTRIIIGASFSGSLTILGNDIDIICPNQHTITGSLTLGQGNPAISPTRVRWTGGNINGDLIVVRWTDVLFDDVYLYTVGRGPGLGSPIEFTVWVGATWARLALLNCTFSVTGGTSDGDWGIYVSGASNVILGNVKILSSGGQNNRFTGINNLLIFDSVFNPDGASGNGMRVQGGCSNVWIRDSWSRSFFKMDPVNNETSPPAATNVLYDNYDRYYTGDYVWQGSLANTGTVRNSTIYGSSFGVSPLTDGGGNASASWDGVTVPGYSTVGAVR